MGAAIGVGFVAVIAELTRIQNEVSAQVRFERIGCGAAERIAREIDETIAVVVEPIPVVLGLRRVPGDPTARIVQIDQSVRIIVQMVRARGELADIGSREAAGVVWEVDSSVSVVVQAIPTDGGGSRTLLDDDLWGRGRALE
ncbi:MAG: hypothetical protein ACE5FG_03275 [Myxococcota bacterium]